eukprot:snap_masked-scaffold_82-processed-gene-0.16-mRNA-1 protein AED:1.00 eAED:1.00 QI:0/0/0/0/1/1/3/0/81
MSIRVSLLLSPGEGEIVVFDEQVTTKKYYPCGSAHVPIVFKVCFHMYKNTIDTFSSIESLVLTSSQAFAIRFLVARILPTE